MKKKNSLAKFNILQLDERVIQLREIKNWEMTRRVIRRLSSSKKGIKKRKVKMLAKHIYIR